MKPVHLQVLEAARACADGAWIFAIADVVRTLPHLNPATVRTHVASRCCVNAPSNHQSRYAYFRTIGRGMYCLEPPYRRRPERRRRIASQEVILAAMDSGVDPTLLAQSLAMSPTARLETMTHAARSLEKLRAP